MSMIWPAFFFSFQIAFIIFLKFLFIIIIFITSLLYFFLLYNIVLVLPHINMNPPRAYTCSPSWTPLSPPSPYHPSGSGSFIIFYSCWNPPPLPNEVVQNRIKSKGSEKYAFWSSFPYSVNFYFLIKTFYIWKFSYLVSAQKLKFSGKFNEGLKKPQQAIFK